METVLILSSESSTMVLGFVVVIPVALAGLVALAIGLLSMNWRPARAVACLESLGPESPVTEYRTPDGLVRRDHST